MEVSEAYSLISRAIDLGRAAHGYLIVGGVSGNAAELAEMILHKLFPNEIAQIEAGTHPDVVTLKSEGKARLIAVESMREKIVEPMATTAFSGGWKVGIIVGADRMNAPAANAFLKSLEEPTPKTMYLLLTDQPDSILPTIVSRTQRIDLKLPAGIIEGDDYEVIAEAFAAKDAHALADKLKDLKASAEDEETALVRKSFYKTLLFLAREMMLGGKLDRHLAFENIESVEAAYRRSEKALNDEAVLSYLMERLVFPA